MLDISAMYLSDPQQVTATNPGGESLRTKLTRWRSVPGSEIWIMFVTHPTLLHYMHLYSLTCNKNYIIRLQCKLSLHWTVALLGYRVVFGTL